MICLNGNFRFRFKEGLDSDFEAFEAFELKHALLQQIICTDLNHSESRELQTFWASGSKLANLPRLAIPQSCYVMLNALDPGSRDVQGCPGPLGTWQDALGSILLDKYHTLDPLWQRHGHCPVRASSKSRRFERSNNIKQLDTVVTLAFGNSEIF